MILTKLSLVVHMPQFHASPNEEACATGISATILTLGLVPGSYTMQQSRYLYQFEATTEFVQLHMPVLYGCFLLYNERM